MNKRNLITTVAFLVPVVVIIYLVASSPEAGDKATPTPGSAVTSQSSSVNFENLTVRRERMLTRLEKFKTMTQSEWDKERESRGEKGKTLPTSLPDMIALAQERIAILDKQIAETTPAK